ncbi:MAG: hypothetical protein II697_03250, partial [Clostridia bacterium]|nr:hypothetical protein [Clostridia bacterium]
IFKLIDAFTQGKSSLGYLMLERMLEANEPVVVISYMVVRQLRLMAHIKSLTVNGLSVAQIKRVLDLRFDSQVTRLQQQCARLDYEKLVRTYRSVVRLQADARSGKLSELNALHEILLRLQKLK